MYSLLVITYRACCLTHHLMFCRFRERRPRRWSSIIKASLLLSSSLSVYVRRETVLWDLAAGLLLIRRYSVLGDVGVWL